MEIALVELTRYVALVIDFMALLIVAYGTIEAFVAVLRTLAARRTISSHDRHTVWMRYARWLVAGLTFQLGADIISTAIAPSWDEIGRLAAIAVIRTFLDFFLERDMSEVRERQAAVGASATPSE